MLLAGDGRILFSKSYLLFLFIYVIEVQLTYRVLGVERCDSGIHTHTHTHTHTHILFLKFFSFVGYYAVLTIVPCAVQYTFVVCCISTF